jgi:hypothetical protein
LVVAEPGLRLRRPDGIVAPCRIRGFDHLARPGGS